MFMYKDLQYNTILTSVLQSMLDEIRKSRVTSRWKMNTLCGRRLIYQLTVGHKQHGRKRRNICGLVA